MIGAALKAWRRRWWRADPEATARFEGLKPIKVVTGGSDGIGLALAKELLRAGDSVLLVARNPDTLAAAAERLRQAMPAADVAILSLDITTDHATETLAALLASMGGYCDLLVNAAGVGIAGDFAVQPQAELDRLADLNMKALTRLTRFFLPDMLVRGRGGVLNVASLAGYAPGPYQAAYYASKAYVINFTEAIAYETAGQGVRMAVLAPGPVRTAFHVRMRGDSAWYLRLLPVASPESVAHSALLRFRLGQRVIVPGLLNPLMMLAVRVTPHRLLTPVIAFLLKPRA